MSDSKDLMSPGLFSTIFLMIIINPKKAFQEIKDRPNILSLVIILPLLAGAIFLQNYVLYGIKMRIPSPLYIEQIKSAIEELLLIQPLYYISLMMVPSIFLTFIVFMIGGYIGGYGSSKHGLSVTGYVYTFNLLGFIITTLVVLFLPTIQTGIFSFIGYLPIESRPNENIVIGLNDYIEKNANLTISFYAHYLITPTTTIQDGILTEPIRIISEEIGKFRSEINIEYTVSTSNGVNRTVKTIPLKDVVINYNTPLEIKDAFSIIDSEKGFKIDLILFLNNTCIFPIKKNISIPCKFVLSIIDSNNTTKTYEIKLDACKTVLYYPDPRPLYTILIVIHISSIITTIWQVILLTISFRIIHEFTLFKTIGIMILYSFIKLLLIGFVI